MSSPWKAVKLSFEDAAFCAGASSQQGALLGLQLHAPDVAARLTQQQLMSITAFLDSLSMWQQRVSFASLRPAAQLAEARAGAGSWR